jgi:hypothetical protein
MTWDASVSSGISVARAVSIAPRTPKVFQAVARAGNKRFRHAVLIHANRVYWISCMEVLRWNLECMPLPLALPAPTITDSGASPSAAAAVTRSWRSTTHSSPKPRSVEPAATTRYFINTASPPWGHTLSHHAMATLITGFT